MVVCFAGLGVLVLGVGALFYGFACFEFACLWLYCVCYVVVFRFSYILLVLSAVGCLLLFDLVDWLTLSLTGCLLGWHLELLCELGLPWLSLVAMELFLVYLWVCDFVVRFRFALCLNYCVMFYIFEVVYLRISVGLIGWCLLFTFTFGFFNSVVCFVFV